jgi:hypothetical protein
LLAGRAEISNANPKAPSPPRVPPAAQTTPPTTFWLLPFAPGLVTSHNFPCNFVGFFHPLAFVVYF